MARVRSPDRDKAFEIYKENGGNIDLIEIAQVLNISPGTIRGWKNKDNWDAKLNGTFQINKERSEKNKEHSKRNKGGQPKNKNAEKFGFFSKYLPEDTMELIENITEKNPLEILWEQISIQYAAIIRAQKIMYVDSKDEVIKEVIKEEYTSEGDSKLQYDFQFSWDRQATFLNSQSRAMGELRSLIKQYNECLKANEDTVSDEEKSRLGKLNSILIQLEGGTNN